MGLFDEYLERKEKELKKLDPDEDITSLDLELVKDAWKSTRDTKAGGKEEYYSPFTVSITGNVNKEVRRIHSKRSQRARSVDALYNAPVTTDEDKWRENPNRYDWPDVDTIPPEVIMRRAMQEGKLMQRLGAVDEIQFKGKTKYLHGRFSPKGAKMYDREKNIVRVMKNAPNKGYTLGHELGHAFDWYTKGTPMKGAYLSVSRNNPPARRKREEAKKLSKQMRGEYENVSTKHRRYRRKSTELFADLYSSFIIQPRATKREVPESYKSVKEMREKIMENLV